MAIDQGGNKMSVLKRALLYVTRKKAKSIIMYFILFGIATLMIAGFAIKCD